MAKILFYILKGNLRTLYFDGNYFEIVPHQLFLLENLQILGLRDNELTEIPNDIDKLKHLKELYLQSNNLKILPPCLSNLNELFGDKSIFTLENNPWIDEIQDCLNISLKRLHVLLSSDAYKG